MKGNRAEKQIKRGTGRELEKRPRQTRKAATSITRLERSTGLTALRRVKIKVVRDEKGEREREGSRRDDQVKEDKNMVQTTLADTCIGPLRQF